MTPREYGTWWAQPTPALRRWAYYLLLRNIYEMPAHQALASIRATEARYPNFLTKGLIQCIREELRT